LNYHWWKRGKLLIGNSTEPSGGPVMSNRQMGLWFFSQVKSDSVKTSATMQTDDSS
jgi:hypothetical protein